MQLARARQRPRLVYWSIKTVDPVSSARPLHSAPRAWPLGSLQRSGEAGGAGDSERESVREREVRAWGEGRGEPSVFE